MRVILTLVLGFGAFCPVLLPADASAGERVDTPRPLPVPSTGGVEAVELALFALKPPEPVPVPAPEPGGRVMRTPEPPVRARVEARRHTILSSQAGGRIETLSVRDGDRFDKGQPLVRLDDGAARAQLSRAQALFRRQDIIRATAEDLARMNTKGEAEVDIARADAEQAAADVTMAEVMVTRTVILAPFAGRVAELAVREKQFVSEGQGLMEIVDDSDLTLEFLAPSAWIVWFVPGYRFAVVIDETGQHLDAELERLGGKVDPVSQSVKAYARLLAPTPGLMVGMSGEARVSPPGVP